MSGELYNLIMARVPQFYSGESGEFTFPIDRFLEYTEDHIKDQFQSLDQNAIKRLKSLPTIFATEQEVTDARIGKITDIQFNAQYIRVKYSFDKNRLPLTKGVLGGNKQKLGLLESGYEFHRGHWGIKESDLYAFYEEYLRSLEGIAQKLKGADKKVQLIYAFNGTGKTRLSRKFKEIIAPKNEDAEDDEQEDLSRSKILYYNAFTEDLFYWDNDLELDAEPKLKIQANTFTDWIFNGVNEQGLDQAIFTNFQHYTSNKLNPKFNPEYKVPDPHNKDKELTIKASSEVTFSLKRGDDSGSGNIKISKGEESIFIWSIFYTLLEQVVNILNVVELSERETNQFDQLEYVFIDDPVSSLDENHLIELAVNLAELIKSSESNLKFIITTHSPLFYNVLHNELNSKTCYLLERHEDGNFNLIEKQGDSNQSFSYHLFLKNTLQRAINDQQVERYHFTLLRNLYEKTASFLGYPKWSELLPGDDENRKSYYNRVIQFTSHSTLSSEAVAEPSPAEKNMVKFLLEHLHNSYAYWPKKEENNG